ncbi:MAG: acyltransferase [Actinomycetota bacterium]
MSARQHIEAIARWGAGELVRRGRAAANEVGSIRSTDRAARRFGAFGPNSIVCFPWLALFGERWMHIGADTTIGPGSSLSVGMRPGQEMVSDPVLSIGDRCVIGRHSSIVAHFEVSIGDDVMTGPGVYITDQNHAYDDVTRPIGAQRQRERPVRIGSGSWLGAGVVVVPGATIGEHVTVAANAVVVSDLPDRSVAAGVPARVVRRHVDGRWQTVGEEIDGAG